MNTPRYALFLLSESEDSDCVAFAKSLVSNHGFIIVSTGDTGRYLARHGIPVNDVSDFIGSEPVFDHQGVPLNTELVYGLYATDQQLAEKGWKKIDLIYITLNSAPLEEELEKSDKSIESCQQLISLGAVSLIRAAVLGKRMISTEQQWLNSVLKWFADGEVDETLPPWKWYGGERAALEHIERSLHAHLMFAPDRMPQALAEENWQPSA